MRKNVGTVFCLILLIHINSGYCRIKHTPFVTLCATAETHGYLKSCNCGDPVGGLSRRHTLLDSMRRVSECLVLDAGGFSAGGCYDISTEGRQRDSLRTRITLKAMGLMRYDAVSIGDEELQYPVTWLVQEAQKSSVPLICANLRPNSNATIQQYIIVKKAGIRFGITAVVTPEKLFETDSTVTIQDPVASLKKIWPELQKKSDVQIILSHMGQEFVPLLVSEFPQCALIVNGHRKKSVQSAFVYKNTWVMQFGFQGKELSALEFSVSSRSILNKNYQWIPVNQSLFEDPIISLLVDSVLTREKLPATIRLDLYIMSQCPYGIPALGHVLQSLSLISPVEFDLWFIGDIENGGSLKSLHGQYEIEEEMKWCALKVLYPHLWLQFLYLRSQVDATTEQLLKDLHCDTIAMNRWIKSNGLAYLSMHYNRSQRLGLEASPTLLLNNQPVDDDAITPLRIKRSVCQKQFLSRSRCDSLPECLADRDCQQKGKIGVCQHISKNNQEQESGTCVFRDDQKITFMVVFQDSTLRQPYEQTIQTTEKLFPHHEIIRVSTSSAKGKKILQEIRPEYLPLYVFDTMVTQAYNFDNIKDGLQRKGMWYTFKTGIMQPHYFYQRPLVSSTVVVYLDPLFPQLNEIVTVLNNDQRCKTFMVVPSLVSKTAVTANDSLRNREARKWIFHKLTTIDTLSRYREKLQMAIYAHSSFIDTLSEVSPRAIDSIAQLSEDLYLSNPCALLINNRELVVVSNQMQLHNLLQDVFTRREIKK